MKRETTNFRCQECGQIVYTGQPHPIECCVSFKAGKEEATKWYDYIYDEGVKAGIKKVVETYKKDNPSTYEKYCAYWKIKCEEWGFDDDRGKGEHL